jgi:L-histidine N-alpha-methyltransferase
MRKERPVTSSALPTALEEARPDPARAKFAADVREFLAREPRELPAQYFYDPLGSALFDAICELPWYRITRAECRLLAAHRAQVYRHLPLLSRIVELGPGSGEKLKLLLGGARSRAATLDVHLIDVSGRALQRAAHAVNRVNGVRIVEHEREYEAGLTEAITDGEGGGHTLVLFLGSNIGNFDPAGAFAVLESIRRNLSRGDALLLGTDLIKPERELLLAYDDPLGVTAAFNCNLLVRVNRELGGNFDIAQFTHQAVWNAVHSRVEMHLVARSRQHARIAAVPMELTMQAGERIWTESSYKYEPHRVTAMLEAARFGTAAQWIDTADAFALTLARAI